MHIRGLGSHGPPKRLLYQLASALFPPGAGRSCKEPGSRVGRTASGPSPLPRVPEGSQWAHDVCSRRSPAPGPSRGPKGAGRPAAEWGEPGAHSGAAHEGLMTTFLGIQGDAWGAGHAPCSKHASHTGSLGATVSSGLPSALCQRGQRPGPLSTQTLGIPGGLRPEPIFRNTHCPSQAQ